MSDEKQIIITPGKPPQFVGAWTGGEVLRVAQELIALMQSLPLGGKEAEHDTEH